MVEICVSRNFSIDGLGRLGVARQSLARTVIDTAFASTGDGTYGRQTSLPGKLMIDGSAQWTNDSQLETMVLVRLQRAYRNWIVLNPNAVQIRDRITYTLDGTTPPVPVTTNVLQSQVGGAIDISTNTTATPRKAIYRQSLDAEMTEDVYGPLAPGATIMLRYRCYLWTPPPWADNTTDPALHAAFVRAVAMRAIALPIKDEAVVQ